MDLSETGLLNPGVAILQCLPQVTFQVASVISSTVLGLSSNASASLRASQDTLVIVNNVYFTINTVTTITCFPSNFSVSKRLAHSNLKLSL